MQCCLGSTVLYYFFLFLRVLKVLLRGAKKICIPPWRRKPYVVKPPLERKNDTPPDPEFLTAPPAKICLPTYAFPTPQFKTPPKNLGLDPLKI